jgi:selenocysteine lyase/cysteine desulfurase
MVKEYGYEYDAALNEEVWSKTEGKVTTEQLFGTYCLRSGRDALKAIAREYPPCVALLPALACDSMVRPFEQYGHNVRYYKLNSDFSIDLNSLNIGEGQTLFLYMDYFGKPSIKDADLAKLRNQDQIIFIEDRTHNLIWHRSSSFQPDYIMASLRKWLPIPDGGLLWGKVTKLFASDTTFSTTRLKAQCMRHEFLSCGDERLKNEYRKIFSTVSDIMDNDEPSYMSAYTYELVNNTDWDKIRLNRKENAEALISILSASSYVTIIQDTSGMSDLYVPFTVANRGEIQRRLSAKGIFNTVIWPLLDEQKCACSVAKFTEENMLAAPCDQRYTVDDMIYIGKEIVRVIDDVNK